MSDDVLSLINPQTPYSVDDVKQMVHGQESNFGKINTSKPNYAGAYGPMQITKPTFEGLKKQGFLPANYDINNPNHSKKAGEILIENLYNKHEGNPDKVLAEYYSGPKAVENNKIHTEYRDLKNPKAPTVGQYIEQAKSRITPSGTAPLDDVSQLISGQAAQPLQKNQSKKSFIEEFKEPLKDISWEGFKKESLGYNAAQLINPITPIVDALAGTNKQKEALKNLYEQGKGMVSGIANVIENPAEALKQVTEHPGQTLGQIAKGIIYDPETAMLPAGKSKPLIKAVEESAITKPKYTLKDGKIVPKEVTPEEIQSGTAKFATPDHNFSEPYYGEKELPSHEQQARKETLERIDPNLKVHENVIKGLGKDRATQYQVAKTDTELGNLYKQQFNEEKNALNQYGEKLIKETGGTFGLDESAKYKSGNIILEPLKKLENHFDTKASELYKARDAEAKTIPVLADNIKTVLADDSLRIVTDQSERLAKAANVKMQQLGMMDKEGNLLPTNGYHAELFRKWLNQNWSREANQLHKALKNAVDEDVLANLDQATPLYQDARKLIEIRKNTLDNPNGISKILEAEGPNGINRKVDIEKIADNITGLGVDQFSHVIDTLRNVPKNLQPEAQKALGEIKAHFLKKTVDAFNKTTRQGTKYLNDNREIMNRIFTKEELNKIRDYNNAHHILKTDTGYPGAGAQSLNIEQKLGVGRKLTEQLAKKSAAAGASVATGGSTFGVAETLAHEFVGGKFEKSAQKKLQKMQKQQLSNEQQNFKAISEYFKKEKP